MENGSAARGAYQRVKERLVSLTIELDDKEHTCRLLSQRIRKERNDSQKQIEELSNDFKIKSAKKVEDDKKKLHETIQKCDTLLVEKSERTSKFKKTAETLKRANETTIIQVEEVKKEGEKELASSRKIWRDGENERKKKFLARKMQEVKEVTLKGLEPELETIRVKHQHEIDILTSEAESQVQSSIQSLNVEHEKSITEIEEKSQQSYEKKIDNELIIFKQRKDHLSKQHHERLRLLKTEYNEEFSEQRRTQRYELEQSRLPQTSNVARVRLEEERRLETLRQQHGDEIKRLEKHHMGEMKESDENSNTELILWCQNIRNQILGKYGQNGQNQDLGNKTMQNNKNDSNLNSDNFIHHISSSTSRIGVYLSSDWSSQELDQYIKQRSSSSSSSSSLSSSMNSIQEKQTGLKLIENIDNIEKYRDGSIENVIRKLEAQQVVKEEEIRKKYSEIENQIRKSHEKDVEMKKTNQLNDFQERNKIEELITKLEREQNNSSARVKLLQTDYLTAQQDLSEFKQAAKKVEEGLMIEKRSVELQEAVSGEEAKKETRQALQEIERIEMKTKSENESHMLQVKEYKEKHQETLENMHLRVKDMVSARGDEITALNEAIQVEQAKAEKLKDLIETHGGVRDVFEESTEHQSPQGMVSRTKRGNNGGVRGDGSSGGGSGGVSTTSQTLVQSPPRMKFQSTKFDKEDDNRTSSNSVREGGVKKNANVKNSRHPHQASSPSVGSQQSERTERMVRQRDVSSKSISETNRRRDRHSSPLTKMKF